MKLTQLLERLEYEVVQGDDQIEVTELIRRQRICMYQRSSV